MEVPSLPLWRYLDHGHEPATGQQIWRQKADKYQAAQSLFQMDFAGYATLHYL